MENWKEFELKRKEIIKVMNENIRFGFILGFITGALLAVFAFLLIYS